MERDYFKMAEASQTHIEAFGLKIDHRNLKFSSLLNPYKSSLFIGFLLILLTNLVAAFLPSLINAGVSMIERAEPFILNLFFKELSFKHIYPLLGLVVVLALLGAVFRTLSRMVLFDVGRIIERDVRARLFYRLTALDDHFYQKTTVGDLMNHLTTDITNIRMVTGFAVLNIMNIILIFLFTVPLLVKLDVTLALCALLPFPLVMLSMSRITKQMFLRTIKYQEQLSELISHVQENLLGAHVVRLFHRQQQESERFRTTNQKTYDAGLKLARVRVLMLPLMRLMVGISVLLVLYVGGRKILLGTLTLGDFVEVNTRILQLSWPAMSVGFVLSIYSRGQASLRRINGLFKYAPNIADGNVTLGFINRIDVDKLVINQKAGAENHISFSVKKGEVLGVVGPSGSFKTILLRSIYRRHSVPFGTIFFDGHDINDLTLNSIYEHIAVVTQESFLFHKSIKENVAFFNANATDQEINDVIHAVRLDKDLKNFTDGIDTVVGERGITLSGGQRQRVALARALLSKRDVIILDDALSAVDADTERHIITRLKSYLLHRIAIVVTHRLSAIRDADRILLLEQGRKSFEGNHDELLKTSMLYQSLWGIEEKKGRLS